MQEIQETTLDEISTPEEILKQYPDKFNLAQITWLLKSRHRNGLQKAGAVLLIGRRFYINKPRFVDWLLAQKS
jgi:hypothetical protein